MSEWIRIHPRDNVAVALAPLAEGAQIPGGPRLRQAIPAGHKFALAPIPPGGSVIKYGFPIGAATAGIAPGEHVHTHNLHSSLGAQAEDYRFKAPFPAAPRAGEPRTFSGYRRAQGTAGIRNELWVLPTVGCVNATGEAVAREYLRRSAGSAEWVDDVRVLAHPYGCSQLGDDLSATRRVLQALACHPNAGGVLVLALGCENNTLDAFRAGLPAHDESRIRFLTAQQAGDEIGEGAELLGQLAARMRGDRREAVPFSELRIGLKCGGSDGFSGITANPLIGRVADRAAALGAAAVLTEVPEMFGAETLLMQRAVSREVFDGVVRLIGDFKRYYAAHNQPVYENPSPGNKAGGITTLEEKALGCTQKAGDAPVTDVLGYGGRVKDTGGVTLLCAPGNDLVSSTALAAAGCQLILFSTGRGTPFGTVVPTLKISTNSALARRKPGWIDFDAGTLLNGESAQDVAHRLTNLITDVLGGRKTRNELNGNAEIAIWKNGVTL